MNVTARNFETISPNDAGGPAAEAYQLAKKGFGGVPNIFQVLGPVPELLKGILAMNAGASSGELSAADIEQIAMTVSGINDCEYCVAVHMLLGKNLKLSETELRDNIQARSSDPRMAAILELTRELVVKRGKVSPASLDSVRQAGISDATMLEVLAVVAIYTFLNYLNHMTKPELDFPAVDYEPFAA